MARPIWWLALLGLGVLHANERPAAPDALYGDLFVDVQRNHVFPDQKTFCDAVPRDAPATIMAAFAAEKPKLNGAVDLKRFVAAHFLLPESRTIAVPAGLPLDRHLATLWRLLRRTPDQPVPNSSLLPLPKPYIVPGGRFREVYYWDSYFTMLGLRECGDEVTIANMVDNFADLIGRFGFVPNGNRTYYLSRSQPPFFALMVELLAEKQGPAAELKYLPALRAEYRYWTDETAPTQHTIRLSDGSRLTRYYDQFATPRPEAFAIDEAVARESSQPTADLYRNIRSAAESGWDFSTRWLANGKSLATIRTTRIGPVDLNCLLYELERVLARASREAGDERAGTRFAAAAEARKTAINRHCWSARRSFYFDYDIDGDSVGDAYTLAGVVPLFLGIATTGQAREASRVIRERFLRPGGVVTTLVHSGQQWDAPNGWAPLEWMTIAGLERYGEHDLAREIASRWIVLNTAVYHATGKMMEKYDVEDLSRTGGGGEYPTQDGFGWTNGVLLKLLHDYPVTTPEPWR